MLKNVVILILLSIVAIFFKIELAAVLHFLVVVHNKIASWIAPIFSGQQIGVMIQSVLSLILLPLLLVLVVAGLYWVIKRGKMPYVVEAMWGVWIILLVTLLAQAV